jgi:hypothetical protein
MVMRMELPPFYDALYCDAAAYETLLRNPHTLQKKCIFMHVSR